jgi:hypothetical protein
MVMTNSKATKAARKAAREAVVAAQEELVKRANANKDDLARFFTARDRAAEIATSFKERRDALEARENNMRDAQLMHQGIALRAMRDRGEEIAEITRLAGIDAKTVRELIKIAEQQPAIDPASNGKKNHEPK